MIKYFSIVLDQCYLEQGEARFLFVFVILSLTKLRNASRIYAIEISTYNVLLFFELSTFKSDNSVTST